MQTELVIVTGAERGMVFPITEGQTLRVGRHADMDVRLSGMSVSRRHCEVSRVGEQVWVRDLGSTNGTIVSGIMRHHRAATAPAR